MPAIKQNPEAIADDDTPVWGAKAIAKVANRDGSMSALPPKAESGASAKCQKRTSSFHDSTSSLGQKPPS